MYKNIQTIMPKVQEAKPEFVLCVDVKYEICELCSIQHSINRLEQNYNLPLGGGKENRNQGREFKTYKEKEGYIGRKRKIMDRNGKKEGKKENRKKKKKEVKN